MMHKLMMVKLSCVVKKVSGLIQVIQTMPNFARFFNK